MSLGARLLLQRGKANQLNKSELMSLGDRLLVHSRKVNRSQNNELMLLFDRLLVHSRKLNRSKPHELMSLCDRFLVQSRKVNRSKNNDPMSLSLPCSSGINILNAQSIPIYESVHFNRPPVLHPHPRAISTPKRIALPRGVARAKVTDSRVLRVFM